MTYSTSITFRNVVISLLQGDITKQDVTAIVNAANTSLLGGGGVDGAIHRAGGRAILEDCQKIRARQGSCAPGQAVITGGGKLLARHVIHTVGPVWRGGNNGEPQTLRNAYTNSLQLAIDNQMESLAFPSISTGAYGYPVKEAASVAFLAVRDFLTGLDNPDLFATGEELKEIRFVLFDSSTFNAYKQALLAIHQSHA